MLREDVVADVHEEPRKLLGSEGTEILPHSYSLRLGYWSLQHGLH